MKSPIQALDSGTLVTPCRQRVGTCAALALLASCVTLGCSESNSDTGGFVLPSSTGTNVNTPPSLSTGGNRAQTASPSRPSRHESWC